MRAWLMTVPRVIGYDAAAGATRFKATVNFTGIAGQGDLVMTKEFEFQMLDANPMALSDFRTAIKAAGVVLRDQLHQDFPTFGFNTLTNATLFTAY